MHTFLHSLSPFFSLPWQPKMFQEVDIMSAGCQRADNAGQNPWLSLMDHKHSIHLFCFVFLSHWALELFVTEAPASLPWLMTQPITILFRSNSRVLKIKLRPAITLLGIYLEKSMVWKDTCTPVFTAAVFTIARTWKQPKCPSTEEWIKKMWYLYTMEY